MKIVAFFAVFTLLAGTAFLVAQEWQRLFPAHQAIQTDCDLSQQNCRTALPDGGELILSITPQPIPLMQPLQINLVVKDSAWQPVYLEITGINMSMGLNRVPFEWKDQIWQAQTTLPICTQRKMQWQAQTILQQGDELYRLNYQFSTNR